LVLGYLAQGRRDLARRQIIRWQQAMAELDIDPSPDVLALWDMIQSTRNS